MSQRNVRSDGVSHWLIHRAARRAPESLSQRLEEEWLADLSARPEGLSRLRFAIGCCWATQVIALEYQPASVPATDPAVAGKYLNDFAQPDSGHFSRRSGTLILVVSLHAVLFYGLVTTLSHIHANVNPDPLQNRSVGIPHLRDQLPPPPQPSLDHTEIVTRFNPLDIPRETDTSREATTTNEPTPSQSMPPSITMHAAKQVQGGPGVGFPDPDDFYPSLARRLEEQGIATVRVCVDAKGRLTSDPTVLQGSGSARLDEGALKLASAGSGHYRASTEDGQPVNSCYPFRIRFRIKN
jgi:TonB family protein